MSMHTVAEAESRLSELIARARAGEGEMGLRIVAARAGASCW